MRSVAQTAWARPCGRRQALMVGVSVIALSGSAGPVRAAGPAPFSQAWYALKASSGPAASAAVANAAAGAGISGKSYAQVQQSLANLQRTARAMGVFAQVQRQAHAIAVAGAAVPGTAGAVPNGLRVGGIVPDSGLAGAGIANAVPSWVGASAPVQTGSAEAPIVTIRQTAPSALLNWRTLNVGASTRLAFDQSAGGAAAPTWVALNRVNDPALSPTQILGQVSAQGHVVIVNNSGIIFTPTAQVTVGSLIASTASISDAQFGAGGIYSPNAATPSFTGARAPVVVEAGAQIATTAPLTATSAGGGVILLGSDVTNHGDIATPAGQTILGAGRDFILQQGYSVVQLPPGSQPINFGVPASIGGNTYFTTQGTAIAVAAGGGAALNDGLLEADRGDVTLVGESVTQAGLAVATSTVATRGTIHLLTDRSDAKSGVVLAPGSVTTVLPDAAGGTALDAQRATSVINSLSADQIRAAGQGVVLLNDQPALPDNQYQSLIQIVSGNGVNVGAGALAMSQGGQIQIAAPGRVLVESGAQLDVSGTVGVSLPMSANDISVNVQGFSLRDNPLNRDTLLLNNSTVFLDTRALVGVAGSATADQNSPYNSAASTPRLYTQSGLLEVSGQVSNVAHTIGEWTSAGGTILIAGGAASQVVAQPGSVFNLAGGSIDYQAGPLRLTWLIGPGGRLYEAQTAPSTLTYSGVYGGETFGHARWNISQTYNNPLVAPASVDEPGYTVGRDGGTLEISAPTAILEGTIDAGVVDGPYQNQPRGAAIADPYLQPRNAVPLPGALIVGQTNGLLYGQGGIGGGFDSAITLTSSVVPIAASLGPTTPLPTSTLPDGQTVTRLATVELDPAALRGLGGLSLTTTDRIDVASPLTLAASASVVLAAPTIGVAAPITARGGSVRLGDEIVPVDQPATGGTQPVALRSSVTMAALSGTSLIFPSIPSSVAVGAGVAIDVRGLLTNLSTNAVDVAGEAAANGGSFTIDTTGSVTLAANSLIDASSGAVISPTGAVGSATGGNVSVVGDDASSNPAAGMSGNQTSSLPVVLAGAIRSFGVSGGGSLVLRSPGVLIAGPGVGSSTGLSPDGRTLLTGSAFQQGFVSYSIDGYGNLSVTGHAVAGVEVAAGVAVQPLAPIYLPTATTLASPTGTDPSAAFSIYLPPVSVQNQTTAVLTPRAGTSLTLQSRAFSQPPIGQIDSGGAVLVDPGASITVDPASNVRIEAVGQITVDGSITAPGGSITIQNDTVEPGGASTVLRYDPTLSVWIGGEARLSVAGLAQVAADLSGHPYGVAPAGGSISIGGAPGTSPYPVSADAYVVIRPGAVLDASGSRVVVDQAAGSGPSAASRPITIAGAGGSIDLNSTSGIALDGTMTAAPGGPGAAGGALTVDLVTPTYGANPNFGNELAYTAPFPAILENEREVTVTASTSPSAIASGAIAGVTDLSALFGTARLSAQQVADAGLGNLTIASNAFGSAGPADVVFAGDVSLSTTQSIDLPGALTNSSRAGHVVLSAPYVTLNGNSDVISFVTAGQGGIAQQSNAAQTGLYSGVVRPSLQATASTLSVRAGVISLANGALAGLDVGNLIVATATSAERNVVTDHPGFASVSLASAGDTQIGGVVEAGGDLSITAAQIYPTNTSASIRLGLDTGGASSDPFSQPHTLTLARTPGTDPAPPLIVQQSLTLQATDIEQGGIVRAPLGRLTLGAPGGGTGTADKIDLLPGSITSVSLAGQTVLYGGTADGVTYGVSGTASTAPVVVAPQVTLQAQSVAVDAGAILDLSGGGTLAGSAFNSGRGGSTDVLAAPLLQIGGAVAAGGDPVYAIVPGYGGTTQPSPVTNVQFTAPADLPPATGEQLTLGAGVAGLPAGTYTLQPAYDALLPGAFRVELQPSVHPRALLATAVGNLSTASFGTLGVAGTGIAGTQPFAVLLTSGANVRRLSAYDEEGFAAFATAEAKLTGLPVGTIPADAGTLSLDYALSAPVRSILRPALAVAGDVRLGGAAGGYGGIAVVQVFPVGSGISAIDIVGDAAPAGAEVLSGDTVLSLRASDLDRLGAETLALGGAPVQPVPSGNGATASDIVLSAGPNSPVAVRTGATLSAPQVFLASASSITLDSGASIDTLGAGVPALGADLSYRYAPPTNAGALLVSNAILTVAAPSNPVGTGTITVSDGATLASRGTVAIDTSGAVAIGQKATFAARDLSFGVSSINVVPASGVAAGEIVPAGLTLSQGLLNGLFAGGLVPGAPALQQIELRANTSFNLFGSVAFGLGPATGSQTLEIDTPSIYGAGAGGDTATITAGTVIWNGIAVGGGGSSSAGVPGYVSAAPAPVASDGPGTGQGSLVIDAGQIVLGYRPGAAPLTPAPNGGAPSLTRTIYGFSSVDLAAARQVVANNAGTLSVHQSQGPYANGSYADAGGNLTIDTPLVTTAAGAVLQVNAGGRVVLTTPGGAPGAAAGLGGEIDLAGSSLSIADTVALPEGKLSLSASGTVALTGAVVDLAGVTTSFFDQSVPGPGGTLTVESTAGGISVDAASTIDVSSPGAAGGRVTLTAPAGAVSLAGPVAGGGSTGGTIDVRAGTLADFGGLNQRLTAGGVVGARSFEVGSGDVAITTADQVRASSVTVSVDTGTLTVDGLVDASGNAPGSISLSAGAGLTLTANAILDAHGNVAQVDSTGTTIDAENTGSVTLRLADGPNGANRSDGLQALTIDAGATIDVSAAANVTCALGPCGQVTIDVPRIGATDGTNGDLAIAAGGPVTVRGAGSIAVNGFWSYAPADGMITQVNTGAGADPNGIGLDQIDAANRSFIASALAGGALTPALSAKLAGLTSYSSFHLRPGVEIDSSTASAGNLTVNGDLDLSGLRYASVNAADQQTAAYGSGEPGVLILRASNDLSVYGSITDGFARPVDDAANPNPDDNGWVLLSTAATSSGSLLDQNVYLPPGAGQVDIGGSTLTTFTASVTPLSVNYALPVAGGQSLIAGTVLPTSVSLAADLTVPPGGIVSGSDVIAADGQTVLYAKGAVIPAGTILPAAASLGAGFVLFAPTSFAAIDTLTGQPETWPAGSSLAPFGGSVTLASQVLLSAGDLIPAGANLNFGDGASLVELRPSGVLPGGLAGQGQVYAASNLLAPGSLSWSLSLAAGANPAAADPSAVTAASALLAAAQTGDLVLSDLHYSVLTSTSLGQTYLPSLSVLRTGTGSLGLYAGGSIDAASSFGIYTGGTQSPGIAPALNQRGSFATNDPGLVNAPAAAAYNAIDASYPQAGGNVTVAAQNDISAIGLANYTPSSSMATPTGSWLIRQGDGTASDPGAFSINFGNYEPVTGASGTTGLPILVGFTGIGTLGGGNLTVVAGRNAGTTRGLGSSETVFLGDNAGDSNIYQYATNLDLVVASTGRATASGTVLTGGGRLSLTVGNALDPIGSIGSGYGSTVVDLRGTVGITAGSIGSVYASVTPVSPVNNPYAAVALPGPDVIVADATANIVARGDLSLGQAGDAGREPTFITSANGATSWFTLWDATTAIDLFSAGGNVSPVSIATGQTTGGQTLALYPPTLSVVAASGSVYAVNPGSAGAGSALELAPSPVGQLQFLARGSIVDGVNVQSAGGTLTLGPIIDISGADPARLPTVATPAYSGEIGTGDGSNTQAAADTLFAFSQDTTSGFIHAGDPSPALFYAVTGDVENLSTGQIVNGNQYIAAKSVRIEAGNDIVGLDHAANSGLFFDVSPNDISVISAGRDIFYANAQVAGPGLLEVSAGGNVDQTQQGNSANNLNSIGYVVDRTVATQNAGAGITVSAGVAPGTLDLTGLADLYANTNNLADPTVPLQSQPGRVERTYGAQLLAFLQQRTGYAGGSEGALAAFGALPPSVQQIFALQVYYAELNQSGLDFNDPTSRFFKSYSEGTEAIRALLPSADTSGQSPAAAASLTLTGGSGIRTQFGGTIDILDPFGATTLGVPGPVPPSSAGVITQGSGDINIYSYGSVLLGQSRVFTTFGGNLLVWLEGNGQINGGQGSSSTIVFTPAQITYDPVGDIALAPTVPSTGAGLATLAPVVGVPAGNVDLVSPFGTIDAGEAGIRSSGNVNLVALTVLNAANVQAGGKVTGVAAAAVPNVAAITAASAASGGAQNASQNNLKAAAVTRAPSIIDVEVVGNGQSVPSTGGDEPKRRHKT